MNPLAPLVSTRIAAELGSLIFVKGTAVLLATMLLGFVVRHRSAAVRHQVWTLGIVCLFALPVLAPLVPRWGSAPLTYPAETAMVGAEAIETPPVTTVVPEPEAGPAPPPARLPLGSALLLTWWVGALALAVRTSGDLTRLVGLVLTSRPLEPDHPASRLLRAERHRSGLRRPVRALLCREDGLAATFGLFRPAVLLGAGVASLPEKDLRPVLIHELAHVRRWDFASNLLTTVASALYWPHPLFWVARHRAEREREHACDDQVLNHGVTSRQYARVLLDFAVARARLSPAMRGTVGFFSLRPARDRIHAILDAGLDRRPLGAATAALTLAATLVLVTPLSSWALLHTEPGTGPSTELVGALRHEDASVRARAARTLGRRDPTAARVELERLVDDPDRQVRLAALQGLQQVGDPSSIPAMARVLERPFDGGRGEHGFTLKLAMLTLGRTDDPRAVRVLERQLDRPVAQLRWLALETITRMPSHAYAALPHLRAFAERDPDPRNRRLAREALERLGT